MSGDSFTSCAYIIHCKNAKEILTKTLKYLHRDNTRKLRQESHTVVIMLRTLLNQLKSSGLY